MADKGKDRKWVHLHTYYCTSLFKVTLKRST